MCDPCLATPWAQICALVNGLSSPSVQEALKTLSSESLQKKLEVLKGKLEQADAMINKIKLQVIGITILNNDAKNWKEDAEAITEEVKADLAKLERSIEANCASGCLPSCRRRYAAMQSMQRHTRTVDELLKRHRPLVKGYLCPHNEFIQETRGDDIDKIWECISQREDVKVVCIHGIAGVGKTAVAQAVCNKALKDVNETYVIWVDAKYDMTNRSLQEEVMTKLSIEDSNNDDKSGRLGKIRKEFAQRKRCLVIIDFVWQKFNLQEIGILEGDARADSGTVCKVILTSRSRRKCHGISNNEYVSVEIKPLSDGWTCYLKNGGCTFKDIEGDAKELVEKAVEGCAGLPSAINKLVDYTQEIQRLSPKEIALSLQEKLSSRTRSQYSTKPEMKNLEYSYMKLTNTRQQCFLYCALYPKGFQIEVNELIDNWIWERLLDEPNGSLEEKRRNGRIVLAKLKRARLLEKAHIDGPREAVKMLSIMHDMAVNVTLADEKLGLFINSGNGLTDFSLVDHQNDKIKRASFMYNKLGVLKEPPNCPNLSTLLLQKNSSLQHLSADFFTKIPHLKILDLSETNIFMLPSSICTLKFLIVLRLRHCLNLKRLPRLSNLKDLIVLDLFGTPLQELPLGMKKLKKLQRLDLSRSKLTSFEARLVGALESLRELLFFMNDAETYTWRSKQSRSDSGEAYVEELSCLDGLRTLHLNFFNQEAYNEYMKHIPSTMSCPLLLHFKLCVGGFSTGGELGENSIAFVDEYPIGQQLPRGTLELYLSECRSTLTPINTLEEIRIDFQKLEVLHLYYCSSLIYVFSFEMLQCLQDLKRVLVQKCWFIKGIIKPSAKSSTDSVVSSFCLPKLQELVMIDLPQLESICPGQQMLEWPEFRRFSVWNCDMLKTLPSIVSKDGEVSKKIKLRGRSFKLDDSHHLEREEANVPTDMVSFVSARKEESARRPMPDSDEENDSRRQAIAKNPTQATGYIVRSVYDVLDLEYLEKTKSKSLGIVSRFCDVLNLEGLKNGFINPSRKQVKAQNTTKRRSI